MGSREVCTGLYIEIAFHNSFLVSSKCLRQVSRPTPAGSESRPKLGTEPTWTWQPPFFPRLTGGSVILFASIVSRPQVWHVINRFISPDWQRSISIFVGNSDLGIASVGDTVVTTFPTDVTLSSCSDGCSGCSFTRAVHFGSFSLVNYWTTFGSHSWTSRNWPRGHSCKNIPWWRMVTTRIPLTERLGMPVCNGFMSIHWFLCYMDEISLLLSQRGWFFRLGLVVCLT